jgi:protein-S-isoprenylcysteine O-methyltransferase Ste14
MHALAREQLLKSSGCSQESGTRRSRRGEIIGHRKRAGMAEKRLSRFGVGPKTFAPSMAFAICAGLVTRAWPALRIGFAPRLVETVGAILIALGLTLWLTGVVTVTRAYKRDQLITSGPFALVRHPVYAGWITMVFPGLALLLRSWPMLLTPLFAYAIFKTLIHVEDDYLARRYGQPYLEYRTRVREVLPIPRFGR